MGPVVARLPSLAWAFLVTEIVRLVDDHEVVIAPIDMREINVTRHAIITREVGVIEHVVVETVNREKIAAVVGFVECPVVASRLGHRTRTRSFRNS